ncbi:MAG: glycosyltransferase family 2 protein, partial [Candidatus Spechtbacterales bacterium]
MSMPKAFVILLNWNNWDETQKCLKSLSAVIYSDYEVIIVDNGSSNGDIESIQSFCKTAEGGIPVFNASNLGFAGGNNVGIKYALAHGADYVMLLNNDTIVAPGFLAELVKAAEGNPSSGILGSRIYKYGTNEVVFDDGKVNKFLNKAEHAASYQLSTANCRIVDYITGAAMLVKREVIERVGLMREEYFLYYEDVDWCLRARRAGYKCVLVPTSKVWHKVSATTKEGSPSYIYYHTRNSLMLAKFNGSISQKVVAYLSGLWILVKQIIKFFLLPSKRVWARAMARGVIDFYRGKYGKYDSK